MQLFFLLILELSCIQFDFLEGLPAKLVKDDKQAEEHFQTFKKFVAGNNTTITTTMRLKSRATGKFLRIDRNKITACGDQDSVGTILVKETVSFNVVRIKEQSSNDYICLNKNNAFVPRSIKGNSAKCMFIEEVKSDFLKRFVSFANYTIPLSFNKRCGLRRTSMLPHATDHRSVLFTEMPISRTRRHHHMRHFQSSDESEKLQDHHRHMTICSVRSRLDDIAPHLENYCNMLSLRANPRGSIDST